MLIQIVLSILLSIILYLIVFKFNIEFLYVSLPHRQLPIPLCYWMIIFLYSFSYSFLRKVNLRAILPKIIILGLVSHLYLLIANLIIQISKDSPLAIIYIVYIFVIGLFFSLSIFKWSINIIKDMFISFTSNKQSLSLYFFSIILIMFIILSIYALKGLWFYSLIHVVIFLIFLCVSIKKEFINNLKNKIHAVIVQKFYKREIYIMGLIFIIAFIVRMVFALNIIHQTGGGEMFVRASDDGLTYNAYGLAMSKDIRILSEVFSNRFWAPGYSVFLGFIYILFGQNFYIVCLIQSFLNSLVMVFIYFITKLAFDKFTAIFASLLTTLSMPMIMLSIVLGVESIFIPLSMLFIYLVYIYSLRSTKRIKLFFVIFSLGLCFGLAFITRNAIKLLPSFIFPWMFFAKKERHLFLKIADCFFIVLIALIMAIPSTVAIYSRTGKITVDNQSASFVWSTPPDGPENLVPSNKPLIDMGIDPFKDIFGSLLSIVKQPLKFISIESCLIYKRLISFLLWPNFGYFDPLILVNPARLMNKFGLYMEFYGLLLFFVGLFSVIKNFKQNWSLKSLIFLLVLYYVAIFTLFFPIGNMRYKTPILPFLMIILAQGILKLSNYVKGAIRGR